MVIPRYEAPMSAMSENVAGTLVMFHDAEVWAMKAESNAYQWAVKDAIDVVRHMKGDKDGEHHEWLDKDTVLAELRKLLRDSDN